MTISLESLQRSLMEAVFDEAALQPALQRFATYCGVPIAQLMFADGDRNLLRSSFSVEMDPVVAAAEGDFQDINPRVLAIPDMVAGRATRDQDFITQEEMARDTAYQELIVPLGLGYFSGVPIINSSDLTAGIALHRSLSAGAFSDEEAARHERAAAACAPVFEFIRNVDDLQAKSALAFAGDAVAAVATDQTGRVVEFNARFEALLREGLVFVSGEQTIGFGRSLPSRHLARCVAAGGGRFAFRHGVDGQALWICSVTLAPRLRGALSHANGLLIRLVPVDTRRTLDEAMLRDAFGLTDAEIDVAQGLFDGSTISEISTRRGVTDHTTRSMVKRLLQKTECRRQAELILRLMPFRVDGL